MRRSPDGVLLPDPGQEFYRSPVGVVGTPCALALADATLDEIAASPIRLPGVGHLVLHDRVSIVAGRGEAVEYADAVVVKMEGNAATLAILTRWRHADLVPAPTPASIGGAA